MARTKQTSRKTSLGIAQRKTELKRQVSRFSVHSKPEDTDSEYDLEDFPTFDDVTPSPEVKGGNITLAEHQRRMKLVRKFIVEQLNELKQQSGFLEKQVDECQEKLNQSIEPRELRQAESKIRDLQMDLEREQKEREKLTQLYDTAIVNFQKADNAYRENRAKLEQCNQAFKNYRRDYEMGLAHKKQKT